MSLRKILLLLAAAGAATVMFLPADLNAAETVALDEIGTTCLQSTLKDCKVLAAGFLNVADYGDDTGMPLIAWQTQMGVDEYDGLTGGFVLFQHANDAWSLLDSGFDGFFQPPYINEERVLHIAGYSQGTGAFNMDRLYQWGDLGHASPGEGWIAVDMDKWFNEITLPGDLAIWKGVDFDFTNPWSGYVVRTSLWHGSDGNCCPTGGSAVIALEIQDNALVATDVTVTPPAKTK